ncbi:ParA family protein [Chitinimonas sp. BJB300]|uniref:ParA family protein n=1 Tax=Chitinimonas sp. BJB300 TaxID=1559339 RepID=UPI000C0E43B2|nr:ParA family protein [Chitinimonas sp. BJB300]PHV10036.1 hypothetical protein CSQ89_18365 [Chitinimonas sp. BJB300]TSJ83015.1 ParA family protein [Chitinimonas sp. BJB300]
MDTSLPWGDSVNLRPSILALMMGFSPAYMTKLEELSGITAKKQPNSPSRFFSPDDLFRIARFRRNRGDVERLDKQICIAVYLPKGGVGKTTTAIELGVQFAIQGYSVLMVDLDPQGDMSQALGYDPELTDEYAEQIGVPLGLVVNHTISDLFDLPPVCKKTPLDKVIKKPYGECGPHLIPADVSLIDFEEYLSIQVGKENRLSRLMSDARDGRLPHMDTSNYDIVIYDCPPGGSTLTTNALLASDIVVSPVSLNMFSLKGISRFGGRLQRLNETFHYNPDVITIPVFFEAKLNRVMDNMGHLRNHFRETTTENTVRKSEDLSAALDARVPVSLLKPKSKVAEDYRMVAAEVIAKAIKRASRQMALPGVLK